VAQQQHMFEMLRIAITTQNWSWSVQDVCKKLGSGLQSR